jgi:mannose-6-phosphate isomerase-like protein (cupin superfamily)
LNLDALLSQVSEANLHSEADAGPAVGGEAWKQRSRPTKGIPMDESAILAQISLQEPLRQVALEKIAHVVASWGLRLPDVPADPLHFGYDDFYRIGETEFNINNNVEQGYCGKFMFMFAGQTCPMHHHRHKHETFFIVKGRVSMELDGERYDLTIGDRLIVDQFKVHTFTALEDSLILESSKPDLVDDSIFDDPLINRIIFGVDYPFAG